MREMGTFHRKKMPLHKTDLKFETMMVNSELSVAKDKCSKLTRKTSPNAKEDAAIHL